jgi:hypothetical protein
MAKKDHPNYRWLLHFNPHREKNLRYAYFHGDDINSYKNGDVDPNYGSLRVVFGSSPKDCYKKANDFFS